MGKANPPGEDDLDDGVATLTSRELSSAPSGGRLRLLVLRGEGFEVHDLPEAGRVSLGRGPQADIRINDGSISRLHAFIHVTAGRGGTEIAVEDLGSSNGTTVRGGRAVAREKIAIAPGEAFDVGRTMVVVQRGSSSARPRRLWSHGDFEVRLEEECERARESGGSFALLRVRGGDPVLLEEALTECLRPFDPIAIYAPGEHEALMVDSPAARSERIAGEIASRLQERGSPARIGLACFPGDGRLAEDLVATARSRAEGGARRRADSSVSEPRGEPKVIIQDAAMEALYRLIDRIAPGDISVLILGETGAGKEIIAETVHRRSARAERPFLRLNCGSLTESLLESELFGHERGAFTGADQTKPGLLETADGGTVFLDEIGELAPATQVKLLRVLEERKVRRVGSVKARDIDVRFVSATNRELEQEIETGKFRRDLFYRLNGISLIVPPLRERKAEIEPLARMFAARGHKASGRRGTPEFTREAIEILTGYGWPGNIRELRNVIERAVLLSGGDPIAREHLPVDKLCAAMIAPPRRRFASETARPVRVGSGTGSGFNVPDEDTLQEISPIPRGASIEEQKRMILDALNRCGGNQTRAARMLGISRRTLISRLDSYGLPRPRKGHE